MPESQGTNAGMDSSDATSANSGPSASRAFVISGLVAVVVVAAVSGIGLTAKTDGSRSGTATECAESGINCTVGDTGPGGGKVFYAATTPFSCPSVAGDNARCTYLEVAPDDWNGAAGDAANVRWSAPLNTTVTVTTIALNGIGQGRINTSRILAAQATATRDTPNSVRKVSDYRGGAKSDWFLPSGDELYQLYLVRSQAGNFAADFYWSSSVGAAAGANVREVNFASGSRGLVNGEFSYDNFRPVRAF
jgi:hypothetical protein